MIDRWRPPTNSLPPKPPQRSRSPSARRDIPPAAPTPPTANSLRLSHPRPTSRQGPSPVQSPTPSTSQPSQRANQWYFTLDETKSSPSILDGLSIAEERLRRAKGVNFLCQAGVALRLPMTTLWVASVFFHRFYMRHSMVEEKQGIHHYNIAATSLFLATKTEENVKKTKDIIVAVVRVAQKNMTLVVDEQSKEYWRWRDSILMYEELMLESLTFDLMVNNLYKDMYDVLGDLRIVRNKKIRESAWTFCNDSCQTILSLLMDSRDIAIASIFFASNHTDEKIDDQDGQPWWKAANCNEDDVKFAINYLLDWYSENPLRMKGDRYNGGSPVFNLDSTRRSGEIPRQADSYSSHNGTPVGTDRGTQSPRGRDLGKPDRDVEANGKRDASKERSGTSFNAEAAEATQPQGDSDAILKIAANDLDHHEGKPNGNDIPSPGVKRKSADPEVEPEAERETKRARLSSDNDEGEVPEA